MYPLRISHSTVASCIGTGLQPTLAALRSGASGLRPCAIPTVEIETHVGEVPGVDDVLLDPALAAFDCRNNRLVELALRQDGFADAVQTAVARHGALRVGLFLGTSTSGIRQTEGAYAARDPVGALPAWFDYARTDNAYSQAAYLRQRFGIAGPGHVVSCACASTAKVFAAAARMIAAGLCDAAVVGGADSLCLTTLYGFRSLNLVAAAPCRPFDVGRDGISIGEAAGFALLERAEPEDDAVLLLGAGESNDAYHMSAPHPEGLGARLAMQRALAAAGLAPAEIGYINLHGTATPAGDASEDQAVFGLFGDAVPCSSTKGQTGHTLGAAGIVEAVISSLALQHGFAPGSGSTETLDPALRSRFLRAAAPLPLRRVMSNSFGFGGSNCSLIFGRSA
jgi:3-oxoacyl-[acyl-carrier-protein] synthase-1